jgi:hypothetical protein
MTMLVAWVVLPAVLAGLCLGCGLLVERAAGMRLPGALLVPSGLALLVVAGSFTTSYDATAELTTPFVLALAAGGYALSFPLRGERLDAWCITGAVGTFAVFAAPVVASGDPTFAGYIKLDDTATWLAFTDHIMERGRELSGLAPSTYEATLTANLPGGYPIGAYLPLGIGHELTGEDPAWLFQPLLALLASALGLSAYQLVTPIIRSRALRPVAVVVGSQAALFYGYALWGGVKELATVPIVALLAALVPASRDAGGGVRTVLPLALAAAALLAILSVSAAVWLLPLLAAAALVFLTVSRRRLLGLAIAFAVVSLLLSLPVVRTGTTFFSHFESGTSVLRAEAELGNLVEPLSVLQLFGIWPTGDFRYDPEERELTYILIAVAGAAGAAALGMAMRARAFGLPIYVLASAAAALASAAAGSPWIDAKAFAMASPAFLLAAITGAAAFFERGRRVEAVLAATAIVGGVLWSNGLAYRDVWLAPYEKLAELEQIGRRVAGQGPTLMTEYEPYGVRHFLREADAEGASELRRRPVPLRDGRILQKAEFADIDEFDLRGLLDYRTLVLRRSPLASRPPSAYARVWEGRYYEIWQRDDSFERIVEHVALGEGRLPAAVPPCADVLRVARRAGPSGRLAAVMRERPTLIELADGGRLFAADPFTLARSVELAATGTYSLWLGAEFRGRVRLAVDGERVGEARHQLTPEHFTLIAERRLGGGLHETRLDYGGTDLHPGSGGRPWYGLGPLVFSRSTAARPIVYVEVSRARTLCGRSLDWLEALRLS